MLETIILIAEFIGQLALVVAQSILFTILVSVAVTLSLFIGALAILISVIQIAITNYIAPFLHACLNMIVAHQLAVSCIIVGGLCMAFTLDKDFRIFVMKQNYPFIFTLCSVVTLILNLLILGHAISNLFVIAASLSVISILYKTLPTIFDKALNQLVKADVIDWFSPLWIDSEILSYATKPNTLQYLLDKQCSLKLLIELISKVKMSPSFQEDSYDLFLVQNTKQHQATSRYNTLEEVIARPHIKSLINTNRITFEDVIMFWPLSFLENQQLQHLLQLGELSINECYNVMNNVSAYSAFLTNTQLDVFADGLKGNSIQRINNLTPQTKRALTLPHIIALMKADQLTLSKLSSLTWQQIKILESKQWMQYFSPKEVYDLTPCQYEIFSRRNAFKTLTVFTNDYRDFLTLSPYLQSKILKIIQLNLSRNHIKLAYKLDENKWNVLINYKDLLITNGKIDYHTLMPIGDKHCKNSVIPGVPELVAANILSFKAACKFPLTISQANVLALYKTEVVQNDIRVNSITSLTETKLQQLLLPAVKTLIDNKDISLEHAINLEETALEVILINQHILSMYRLTETQRNNINLLNFQQTPMADRMLANETTHIVSVHMTSSQSAKRLLSRYPNISVTQNLETLQKKISMTHHQHKNAALRCLKRLRHRSFIHTDAASNITITQLLALAYAAISDESIRHSSYADSLNAIVNGLYDCQRGGNLDNNGEDDRKFDCPICPAGTFNKIIEALCGVHPDAWQSHITNEIAAQKVPIIVKDATKNYLNTTLLELTPETFKIKLDTIRELGVEVIYDSIKHTVKEKLSDEFSILFLNNHHLLKEFINSGIYTDISSVLDSFSEEIATSFQHPNTMSGSALYGM